jgi:hypothetical protein
MPDITAIAARRLAEFGKSNDGKLKALADSKIR